MVDGLRNTEVAQRGAPNYKKCEVLYKQFVELLLLQLVEERCEFPVDNVTPEGDYFYIFGTKVFYYFTFTHDTASNQYIGIVVFDRLIGSDVLPVFTMYFDVLGNTYFSESRTFSSHVINDENTARLAVAQVAAGVMETKSFERICKSLNGQRAKFEALRQQNISNLVRARGRSSLFFKTL